MIAVLKRLYGFRQRRISARKYAKEQQRLVARLSGIASRNIRRDINREVARVGNLIQAANEPTLTQIQTSLLGSLQDTLTKHYKRCYRTVYDGNRAKYEKLVKKQVEVGTGFDFSRNDDLDRDIAEHILLRQNYITNVSDNVASQIIETAGVLRLEGVGNDAIGRELSQRFSFLSRRRADVIARTETHAAVSTAQDRYHTRLADRYAIQVRKKWLATSDGRTRSAHTQMNGTEIAMDEKFVMPNGTRMKHVGDPAGGPANTINCRCVILYVDVEDEVEDVEIDRPQEGVLVSQLEEGKDGLPNGIKLSVLEDRISDGSMTHALAKQRNSLRLKSAASDDRYYDAKRKTIYRGSKVEDYGKDATSNTQKAKDALGVKTMAIVDQLMEELEVLAKKFNIPGVRGIKTLPKNSRTAANMGDGVMGVNFAYLRRVLEKGPKTAATWRRGDDVAGMPMTTDAYLEDPLDKVRVTFYHEFAHHIHQIKGIKKKDKYEYKPNKEGFIGKWERSIDAGWKENKKLWRSQAVSQYGGINGTEWFAENFSLWAMRRDELLGDEFKLLIKNILEDDT